MTTPLSSMGLVFIASLIGSFGAVFLKMGADRLKMGVRHVISVPAAIGVALFLVSSVFFVLGIRHGELSVLYPMVSLGYIWTMVWSRLFFNEPITRPKYMALGMILVGITMIARAG